MNKLSKYYLTGASMVALTFSLLASTNANAGQCYTMPSCEQLGYTQSSCESGVDAIKCPFNTALMKCVGGGNCETLGYTETSCPTNTKALKCPTDSNKFACVPDTCGVNAMEECNNKLGFCVRCGENKYRFNRCLYTDVNTHPNCIPNEGEFVYQDGYPVGVMIREGYDDDGDLAMYIGALSIKSKGFVPQSYINQKGGNYRGVMHELGECAGFHDDWYAGDDGEIFAELSADETISGLDRTRAIDECIDYSLMPPSNGDNKPTATGWALHYTPSGADSRDPNFGTGKWFLPSPEEVSDFFLGNGAVYLTLKGYLNASGAFLTSALIEDEMQEYIYISVDIPPYWRAFTHSLMNLQDHPQDIIVWPWVKVKIE